MYPTVYIHAYRWMDRYTPHVSRAYHSKQAPPGYRTNNTRNMHWGDWSHSLSRSLPLYLSRWAVCGGYVVRARNRIAFLLLDNVQRAIGDLNDYDFDNFEATLCDFSLRSIEPGIDVYLCVCVLCLCLGVRVCGCVRLHEMRGERCRRTGNFSHHKYTQTLTNTD